MVQLHGHWTSLERNVKVLRDKFLHSHRSAEQWAKNKAFLRRKWKKKVAVLFNQQGSGIPKGVSIKKKKSKNIQAFLYHRLTHFSLFNILNCSMILCRVVPHSTFQLKQMAVLLWVSLQRSLKMLPIFCNIAFVSCHKKSKCLSNVMSSRGPLRLIKSY